MLCWGCRRPLKEGTSHLGCLQRGISVSDLIRLVEESDVDGLRSCSLDSHVLQERDRHGVIALVRAAEKGAIESLRILLARGADPDARSANGFTALHAASASGHVDVVRVLMGKTSEYTDEEKNTPLHISIIHGQEEMALFLLSDISSERKEDTQSKLDVNATNNKGDTPLHLAVRRGLTKIVDRLLVVGADANSLNTTGETPLIAACLAKCPEAALQLLDGRGDALNVLQETKQRGRTALSISCLGGDPMLSVVRRLIDMGVPVSQGDWQGYTPFLEACAGGGIETVKYLLEKGARITDKAHKDRNALMLASAKGWSDIVEILLGMGADVEDMDEEGRTAIHFACAMGHENVLKLLLKKGGSQLHRDMNGEGPLFYAIRSGNVQCVETLLKKGFPVNERNTLQATPLHTAAAQGLHGKIALLLLRAGAVVSLRDQRGETPLHYACRSVQEDSVDIVRVLLDHDESRSILDTPNVQGNTPLMLAVKQSSEKCTELLLERGADPTIVNTFGEEPIHVAYYGRTTHPQLFTLLKTYGARYDKSKDEIAGELGPYLAEADSGPLSSRQMILKAVEHEASVHRSPVADAPESDVVLPKKMNPIL